MKFKLPTPFALAVAAGLLAGCEPAPNAKPVTSTTPVSKAEVGHDHAHEHAHEEHGPNGGHIIEFGKYHGEVAMSPEREIAVYILGDDAKTATPVEGATVKLVLKVEEKDVTLEAKPTPKDGETAEKTSKFVVAAADVPASIKDIEGVIGTVELKIADETMTAKVEHDHGHEHDHDEDHDHAEPKK